MAYDVTAKLGRKGEPQQMWRGLLSVDSSRVGLYKEDVRELFADLDGKDEWPRGSYPVVLNLHDAAGRSVFTWKPSVQEE